MNKIFNVKPSPSDQRDFAYKQRKITYENTVDLRQWDSVVENQGNLSSCVGNAVTNCYELMVKESTPENFVDLSRLFVYFNARVYEGSENIDDGVVYIRDALRGTKQYGICTETIWPYIEDKVTSRPSPAAYTDAQSRRTKSYTKLNTLGDMLDALTHKNPIIVGLNLYENFMSLNSSNATLKLPSDNTSYLGGHSMCIVGYYLDKQQFIAKNSFGANWGSNGYCYIPFEYIRLYCFEKWIISIKSQTV